MGPAVRIASTPAERERASATILLAFSQDPIIRWIYPDTWAYLTFFPRLLNAIAGRAYENNTAYCTEDFSAVALWLSPGVAPDGEAMGVLIEESIDDADKEEFFEFLEQMHDVHPKEPHWYLPTLGVDPVKQGMGYGSALLRHSFILADEAGLPSYLESSNPRNVPLYRRHGFEVIGTIQTASSPPMWPMLRRPAPARITEGSQR
jgi:ribosomal protein S18 acetylase RimI-like enzyme